MRVDIDWRREIVHLRGTKTRARGARSTDRRRLVRSASARQRYAEGAGGLLFRPWANTRRDLNEACARAAKAALAAHLTAAGRKLEALGKSEQASLTARCAFPSVSPNDLRRTYATWLRQHGTEPHLIAVALGHTDSRMAERVYGRVPIESLGRMLADRVGDCSAFVANTGGSERLEQHIGQLDHANFPVNLVPRDRIELPTRGFQSQRLGMQLSKTTAISIHNLAQCSTIVARAACGLSERTATAFESTQPCVHRYSGANVAFSLKSLRILHDEAH
jgi:hypothetical protein